jgi:hypothetical protein
VNGEGELHGTALIHLAEIELNVVMEFLVRPGKGKAGQGESTEKNTPPACSHGGSLTGLHFVSIPVPPSGVKPRPNGFGA